MLGLDRITFDPNMMGGRACIRGMRVSVSLIVNLIANGMTVEGIIETYPYLESEDIRQALQYAPHGWQKRQSTHWSRHQREIPGRYGPLSEGSGVFEKPWARCPASTRARARFGYRKTVGDFSKTSDRYASSSAIPM